jgi:hypothetical protein
MLKLSLVACAAFCATASASQLTATESAWLRAASAPLAYSQALGLPLDIVVQPEPTPGQPALAMGFRDGRCKLVLSMRGNPRVDDALSGFDPALRPILIEAMAAHEIAHCWRRAKGLWGSKPGEAGASPEIDPEDAEALRSEEAFADLAALAWIAQRRAAHSPAIQSWLEAVRADASISGASHATSRWVELARGRGSSSDNVFEQASTAWALGWKMGYGDLVASSAAP